MSAEPPAGTTPNAALMGAALAFGRAAPKQRPNNTGTKANGSLNAAASAGQRSKTSSPEGKSPNNASARPGTGSSRSDKPGNDYGAGGHYGIAHSSPGMPRLQVAPAREQSTSPSQLTATLAANRASPAAGKSSNVKATTTHGPNTKMPVKPAAPPKPRRLSAHNRSLSHDSIHSPTDDSPILPTTSLVSLFERKSSNDHVPQKKRVDPIVVKPSSTLAIKSPTPVRTASSNGLLRQSQDGMGAGLQAEAPLGIQEAVFLEEEGGGRQEAGSGSRGTITSTGSGSKTTRGTRTDSNTRASASNRSATRGNASTGSNPSVSQGLKGDDQSSPEEPYFSASEDTAPSPAFNVRKRPSGLVEQPSPAPPMPPPRRSQASPSPLRSSLNSTSAPVDIKLSARSVTSPLSRQSTSDQSQQSITATYHQLHPRRMTPLTSNNDLANAMVASSLASSRAPSPRKLEIPAPKQHHHHLSFSRTPSPAKKGMRHTLRKEDSTTSDTGSDEHHPYGKHRKKRIVRKHPNKHHEGDRKRWRDAVTERERKRYEGLWAANRGLYTEQTPDHVSSIIVRDIWNRSRLPEHELEEIWDLVDTSLVGSLGKEEFVVGLWLIDQRLKGRKLPPKVSPTVWASVRGLQGIKVKKFVG